MCNVRHVTVFQEHELAGLRYQRRDVRCHQHGVFTDTDHQRAAAARGNQATGFVLADHAEGERPFQVSHGRLHGCQQVLALLQVVIDLVHDDLGIGLRGEPVTRRLLLTPQYIVILDNAVVHQRNTFVTHVGMGVLLARDAVRGPARVRDTGQAADRCFRERLVQLGDLADLAHPLQQVLAGLQRHAGGVIAAVLEPLQAIHEHGQYILLCRDADYSAHVNSLM